MKCLKANLRLYLGDEKSVLFGNFGGEMMEISINIEDIIYQMKRLKKLQKSRFLMQLKRNLEKKVILNVLLQIYLMNFYLKQLVKLSAKIH